MFTRMHNINKIYYDARKVSRALLTVSFFPRATHIIFIHKRFPPLPAHIYRLFPNTLFIMGAIIDAAQSYIYLYIPIYTYTCDRGNFLRVCIIIDCRHRTIIMSYSGCVTSSSSRRAAFTVCAFRFFIILKWAKSEEEEERRAWEIDKDESRQTK